jgi:hypothetical protein
VKSVVCRCCYVVVRCSVADYSYVLCCDYSCFICFVSVFVGALFHGH